MLKFKKKKKDVEEIEVLDTEIDKKVKKKRHRFGRKEFIFNFVSIVFILGVVLYYGGRCFYYYSKQNIKVKEEAMTLNGLVVQNNPIAKENNDGLHQDNDGYYFKGNVTNNYVIFENRLFRIMRVNNNNTVKLISENFNASFMWGEEVSYANSNVRNWLEKTEQEHSGIYLDTIVNATNKLKKTEYREDIMKSGAIEEAKESSKDYATILTVKDYIIANGKSSYLNNGKMFFLLGLSEENENLYVEEDGSIQTTDSLSGYGIRPVITLKKNTEVASGSGSKEDPYVVKAVDKNYVDTYVQLGEDTYRVSGIEGDNLRLYLNGYIMSNGAEVVRNYSSYNSIYNVNEKTNIGNYLNSAYLGSLPYQGVLADCNFYTGEISDDTGYSLNNIYGSVVTAKVGLLNIFDYISHNDINDYFHINTTSQVGSMEYNTYANGLLEEADVRDVKHIVPVVCINKDSIKSGEGSLANPYKVE